MVEKIIDYGTEHKVNVQLATDDVIMVIAPAIGEGFILVGHGLKTLPQKNDSGKIVFERDKRKGHWQYYPQS